MKRSGAGPRLVPNAAPSASRCGAGSASMRSSMGRQSWCRPANGSSISDSTPLTRAIRHPDACSSAYSSRAVLPTPGSPCRTSARGWCARRPSSSRSSTAHSLRRPLSLRIWSLTSTVRPPSSGRASSSSVTVRARPPRTGSGATRRQVGQAGGDVASARYPPVQPGVRDARSRDSQCGANTRRNLRRSVQGRAGDSARRAGRERRSGAGRDHRRRRRRGRAGLCPAGRPRAEPGAPGGARRGHPEGGAGDHDQHALRLRSEGRRDRRADDPGGRRRGRGRRRDGEHVARAVPRSRGSLRRPAGAEHADRLDGARRPHGRVRRHPHGNHGREPREPVRDHAGRAGRVRGRQPAEGRARGRGAAVPRRDRPDRGPGQARDAGHRQRRGPARRHDRRRARQAASRRSSATTARSRRAMRRASTTARRRSS